MSGTMPVKGSWFWYLIGLASGTSALISIYNIYIKGRKNKQNRPLQDSRVHPYSLPHSDTNMESMNRVLADISSDTNQTTWKSPETESLLSLFFSIAEEQTKNCNSFTNMNDTL